MLAYSNVKPVGDAVNSLTENGYLELRDRDVLRPRSRILLTDPWHDEITDWLHESAPITASDIADFKIMV